MQSVPESDEAWDHLEELAERLERPADTAKAYRDALAQPLARELRTRLGQRALRFHEAWFGDDPEVMHALLLPFVDGDPANAWAFERLTRVLTLAERFATLLDTYDRALARTTETGQRKKLLDDAAHIAKDFADQSERAIGYLQELNLVDRDNAQIAASLERLLERCDRTQELIALWRKQIEQASGEEARALRLRIADCYLTRLNDSAAAVAELGGLLDDAPGHAQACEQLEGVLGLSRAPLAVRLDAFALLRRHYDVAQRPEQAIAAIETALALAEGAQRRELHRDAAQRLAIEKRDAQSMQHYAELLAEEPSDTDARRQLRRLADRSSLHALEADALVVAAARASDVAQRASLWSAAAELRANALGDPAGAIVLLRRILTDQEMPAREAAGAARELASLLSPVDQGSERLSVLESLATFESSKAARDVVLGEVATLAEHIGEIDRALSAWRTRLVESPRDVEALNASVRLLAQAARFEPLLAALRQRSECELPPELVRADLMQIATLQLERLDQLDAGIVTLLEVVDRFGIDEAVLEALDRAMTRAGRFAELADLMRRGLADHHPRAARWLVRLADILHRELQRPERALGLYVQALGLDGRCGPARDGLSELAPQQAYARSALDALARSRRELGEWNAFVQLTSARVEHAESDSQRARILFESAHVEEEELSDPAQALRSLCTAFAFDPLYAGLEHEMTRLGELTGRFDEVASAYGNAASAALHRPDLAVRLEHSRALLLETRGGDLQRALSVYVSALQRLSGERSAKRPLEPSQRTLLHAIVRCASALASWELATDCAVQACCLIGAEESELLGLLEGEASEHDAWDAMCERFAIALGRHAERMGPELCYRLEIRLALWYRHRAGNLAAAEAIALRALEKERTRSAGAALLCDIQRHNDSPLLVDTLLRLDAIDAAESVATGSRNLDLLFEAVERVLTHDRARASEVVLRLYTEAARLWGRGETAAGARSPAASATFAVEHLVRLDVEQGRVERAVQLLLDAAKLPLSREESRSLRTRAAELLTERGQLERAVEVQQALAEENPSELAPVLALGALLERLDRTPELIWALRRELALNADPERGLVLRLRLAALVGELEQDDGRLVLLQDNLAQEPGHTASVEAMCGLLLSRGRAAELALRLSEQAKLLEQCARPEHAALLWGRVADLFEHTIGDVPSAIAAGEREVALALSPARLSTLARLCLVAQQPAQAATWLARRLEHAAEPERVPLLLQLARAQLSAGQHDAAVASLEIAFAEAPKNSEVRKLLLQQHRARGEHAALARTLSKAAEQVSDGEAAVAYGREAATIYRDRLGRPELAIDVLVRARKFAPEDRGLLLMLAEAKLGAGELADAETLLRELLDSFGARRSTERAAAHLLFSRVLQAKPDVEGALDQLDAAHKMDGSDALVIATLAELAREAGQLERAERAYRALLLIVRERPATIAPASGAASAIGPAEVLMQLSWIAAELGQHDKAQERCESALEALAKNDADAQRTQAAVLARADHQLLRRVLETRLSAAASPQRRAQVLFEYGALLAGPFGDRPGALERWLQAVECDPSAPQYHEAALQLAREAGETERYAGLLRALLERANTPAQSYARCELLLRLGQLTEADDLERARELYEAAEATGVREVDVWRAQAGLAAARGDRAQQVELLTRLSTLGEHGSGVETRADALYRLAEIQLAHPDSHAEGVASLSRALADDARNERAGRILERACQREQPDPDLLLLYERVARDSKDEALLLGFLEHRARRDDAVPEEIREAAELARKYERLELAEELMQRAVRVAAELPDGAARVQWALLSLCDRRHEQGDLAGAVRWLLQASESAPIEVVIERAAKIAALAQQPEGDLTLAAKLYEHLLEKSPTSRDVWGPLADIYEALGDLPRFERLVEETLDSLGDVADRNRLRLQHACLLIEHGGALTRASELLREVLVEDPRHARAQELLIEVVARSGRPEDLLELLEQQLAQAQARGDKAAVKAAALRLGTSLHAQGALADETDVYREALSWVSTDRELCERLLLCLGQAGDLDERAQLVESLLPSDDREQASAHALAAAQLHEQRNDAAAVLRVLEQGRRLAPQSVELVARLEHGYREAGDYAALAQLLRERADAESDTAQEVELLLAASALYRERLSQPAEAVLLLERAAEIRPSDLGIARELAMLHSAQGRPADAVEQLGRALAVASEPVERCDLLRLRAEALRALGDTNASLADLEEAFRLSPEAVAPQLEAALEELRRGARSASESDQERELSLRLVDVLCFRGKPAQARKALSEWVARAPDDVAALQRLLKLCEAEGDALGITETAARIVGLSQGPEQQQACAILIETATRIVRFDLARAGLEVALELQPNQPELRTALKEIYERSGALHELAEMILQDAASAADENELAALLKQAAHHLIAANQPAQAIQTLRDALSCTPNDAELTFMLVDAYADVGDTAAADALLDELLPMLAGKRAELGQHARRKVRLADASADAQTKLAWLVEASKYDKDVQLLVDIANLAESLQDWDVAEKALRNVVLLKGEDLLGRSEIYLRQARIWMHRGDNKRALMFARKAQREEPEAAEVVSLLQQLGAA